MATITIVTMWQIKSDDKLNICRLNKKELIQNAELGFPESSRMNNRAMTNNAQRKNGVTNAKLQSSTISSFHNIILWIFQLKARKSIKTLRL